MTLLSEVIRPRSRYARSVNLERDFGAAESVAGYIPTPRALDVLGRFAKALDEGGGAHAWSITGPYGSGKSALANFLIALTGPPTAASTATATEALRSGDRGLASHFTKSRSGVFKFPHGLIRCSATARREWVGATVLRAIARGASDYWAGPGRRPAVFEAVRTNAGDPEVSESTVVELLEALTQYSAVLLIIDEFGKNLEHAADTGSPGDLFLLQEIAEAATRGRHPVLLFTIQHLAFEEYAAALTSSQMREWRKVQGRFEDIAFVDPPSQTIRLLARVLESYGPRSPLRARVRRWAAEAAVDLRTLGLESVASIDEDNLRRMYPIHPLVSLVLPELCARYAQNDRSLFTFMSGPEDFSVPWFLRQHDVGEDDLPLVRLDQVYDYFVETLGAGRALGSGATRWLEIQGRLREARGLSTTALRCLKAVAVLNLVAGSGALRASRDIVSFALSEGQGSQAIDVLLQDLEEQGLLIYRAFADEYRVWQGSDLDVEAAISVERERAENGSFIDQLSRALPLRPVIARRHSQETSTLRYFERRYALHLPAAGVPCLDPTADGLILHLVSDGPPGSAPRTTTEGRPLVAVWTPDSGVLKAAALEAAATVSLLRSSHAFQEDKVARRELAHRAAVAQEMLRSRLYEAFRAGRDEVLWLVSGETVKLQSEAEFSHILSELSDRTYVKGPRIPNEMLNRRELTSQAAKARRNLLEAMIRGGTQERLAIEGFGPERSMYEAGLRASGIHRPDDAGEWSFGPPSRRSGLTGVWGAITQFFNSAVERPVSLVRLYEVLEAPPIGMKEGAIPVLLLAALLYRTDDIAIYQDGTYQPTLTPDLVERLLKIPERFAIKQYESTPARALVLERVHSLLRPSELSVTVQLRNSSLLSVVGPLVRLVRSLPEFSLQTRRVSDTAQRIRQALMTTREPDSLVFQVLPEACDLGEFAANEAVSKSTADQFGERLRDGLLDLTGVFDRTLDELLSELRRVFAAKGTARDFREDVRARSRHLVDQVLDPRMRSFLLLAAADGLDDREWLEALAMNLSQRPPRSWSDEDVQRCWAVVSEVGARFRRLEALYYDMREHSRDEGFEAMRLTMTEPQGRESARVLWVDASTRETLRGVAADALKAAESVLGERGREALLALVADEVLVDLSESQGMIDVGGEAG